MITFKLSFYKMNKNDEYQNFHNFIVELKNKNFVNHKISKSIFYHANLTQIVIKILIKWSFNCECEMSWFSNIHNNLGDDLVCEIVIDTMGRKR